MCSRSEFRFMSVTQSFFTLLTRDCQITLCQYNSECTLFSARFSRSTPYIYIHIDSDHGDERAKLAHCASSDNRYTGLASDPRAVISADDLTPHQRATLNQLQFREIGPAVLLLTMSICTRSFCLLSRPGPLFYTDIWIVSVAVVTTPLTASNTFRLRLS